MSVATLERVQLPSCPVHGIRLGDPPSRRCCWRTLERVAYVPEAELLAARADVATLTDALDDTGRRLAALIVQVRAILGDRLA